MKQLEDRLGKYVISYLFADWTRVEVGADLLPDSFYADVLMIPDEPLPLSVPGAGLLCELTGDARCLIEPFSGSVEAVRLEGTLTKLRLTLQRAHNDGLGVSPAMGVLWLITTYWPNTAMEQVFAQIGKEVEPGLLMWQWSPRETVFWVNTSEIALREDTLLFRLLGKGRHRREAVVKIIREHLEPYVTLLNNFDMRFKQMTPSELTRQFSPEELENMIELRDTRMEVLLKEGREEGLERGLERGLEKGRDALADIARLQVRQRFPRVREATLEPLAEMSITQLQFFLEHILSFESTQDLRRFLKKLQTQ